MSEMIERVARAICEGDGYAWDEIDEQFTDVSALSFFTFSRDCFREMARLAIAAMREPTDAMLAAWDSPPGFREQWKAMIDEALRD